MQIQARSRSAVATGKTNRGQTFEMRGERSLRMARVDRYRTRFAMAEVS